MLYNEERPHRFDDVVGQRHIVENIRNQSKENKWFQVYIFAGQYGGGKTSMERIVSLAVNCHHKDENGNPCLECESCKSILSDTTTDIMEIDGASNTGVDSIRDLRDNVGYMPVSLPYKIYAIDEVHMLSKGAFNALLKVLEEPPKYVIFILCTTDLKAIPATVRSRAATYIFEQIPYADIFNRLGKVTEKRSYDISNDALALIAKNAQGSMRNAYALLEQVTSGSNSRVEADDVQRILGITNPSYLFAILKNIILANIAECITLVERAAAKGKDMSLLVNDLIDIVADAVVSKSASVDRINDTENYKELLVEIVNMSYIEQLCQIANGLMDIRVDLRKSPSKTTVVVGIIRITTSTINASILSRLEEVEKALQNGSLPVLSQVSEKSNIMHKSEEDSEAISMKEDSLATDVTVSMSNVVAETFYESDMAADECVVSNMHGTQVIDQVSTETIKDNVLDNASENIVNNNTMDLTNDCDEPSPDNLSGDDKSTSDSKDSGMAADEQIDEADKRINQTEEITDEDEFDVFSLFEEFNSLSFENPLAKNITDVDSKQQNISPSSSECTAKQKRLEERLRLVSEDDKIFSAALQGCVKTMRNGLLVLRTPLQPVCLVVQTYLKVSEIKDVTVEFDAMISLN